MARAMLAVAAVQALLAAAVATAPSTARDEPMGALGVLALSGLFVRALAALRRLVQEKRATAGIRRLRR